MEKEMVREKKKVSYVVNGTLLKCCDAIPAIKYRATMVHSLIAACNLLPMMQPAKFTPASEDDIRLFHSEEYVKFLQSEQGNLEQEEEEEDDFGLGFDCPVLKHMWSIVQHLAGGSLSAADTLIEGSALVAINWLGGWHHAQRDSASGFCYVNDVVLAIQRLLKRFDKVLYIDLDIHHGDGVEDAFSFSKKVLTLSMHIQESGFFPGTGSVTDIGKGKGRNYTVNVPFRSGINDKQFVYLFESIIYDVYEAFLPSAIVCQCGADGMSKDPLGTANLTSTSFIECVSMILGFKKPTLFLGGGGYNRINCAKLWTALTCTILGEKVPEEIPEHEFFSLYGPYFSSEIDPTLRKSENTNSSLNEVIAQVKENLRSIES